MSLPLRAALVLWAAGCATPATMTGQLGNLDLHVVSATGECIGARCQASILLNWHGRRSVADEDLSLELRLRFDRNGPGTVTGDALVIDSRALFRGRECSLAGTIDAAVDSAGSMVIDGFTLELKTLNVALRHGARLVVMRGPPPVPTGMWSRAAESECFAPTTPRQFRPEDRRPLE